MKPVFACFLLCWITVMLAACHSSERKNGSRAVQESLYVDCKVSGEEAKENVDCVVQFHLGGPDGPAVLPKEPLKIELDGEDVRLDSARFSGVFYEAIKPLDRFVGKHTLVFTDAAGNAYREEFEFSPFSLEGRIPSRLKRAPFIITLKKFPSRPTLVQLVLVDTAFETNDVNEIVVVNQGKLFVTEAMLSRLKTGPLFLAISREEEILLKKGSRWRGRIVISYGLKREFELVD